ncbi:MAG: cell division ATPase MinD [Candidatus Woesearchaeota archaeon]
MRTIAIASAKGGVGKTCSTINLGFALNSFNKDTTIIDTNISTPNIAIHLGAYNVPITLNHVLQGKHHITAATYVHNNGTKIIPSSLSMKNSNVDLKYLSNHLKDVKSDIVLLDTSAGINYESSSAISSANEVLIITTPDIPSITDALKTVQLCKKLNKPILGIVVTRYDSKSKLSINNIEMILENKVISVIPEDVNVKESIHLKQPLIHSHPDSQASIEYKKLAAYLINHPYTIETKEDSTFVKVARYLFGK